MAPLLVVALIHLALANAERRRRGWSAWRMTSFVAGVVLIAVATSPWFHAHADHDFQGHMAQHLVLGMIAPLGLVLAAPMTLMLRMLPHGTHADQDGCWAAAPSTWSPTRSLPCC